MAGLQVEVALDLWVLVGRSRIPGGGGGFAVGLEALLKGNVVEVLRCMLGTNCLEMDTARRFVIA